MPNASQPISAETERFRMLQPLPLMLSLDGDLSTISSVDVTIIPSNIGGLVAASRLRAQLVLLKFPAVMLATPDVATCSAAMVDCLYFDRISLNFGRVARVLLAKTYAVMKLFEAQKDVFVCDSDVAVFQSMANLWRGELANTSLIVQEEYSGVVLNSGMLRVQHVEPTADATVGWLLREWVRRVFTIGFTSGCSGCDQPVLNELVHMSVQRRVTFNVMALSDAFAYPSNDETRQRRRLYRDRLYNLSHRAVVGAHAFARERGLSQGLARSWQHRAVSAWMLLHPPKRARLHSSHLANPEACVDNNVFACYPHILRSSVSAYVKAAHCHG